MANLSIIIPSYERDALAHELRARILSAHPDVEVIIVSGLTNTSRARNIGIRQATGEILLFLDNDVDITPSTLGEHLRAYEDPTVGSVAGRVINDGETVPEISDVPAGQVDVLLRDFVRDFWSTRQQDVHFPYGCHFSCRRDLAYRVGLLDEEFPNFFDEVDFGLRLSAAARMVYIPEALVYHHRAPGGGVTRAPDHIRDQHLYHAYGRMIAKHVPLYAQPLSLALRLRTAMRHRAATAYLSGYLRALPSLIYSSSTHI